MRCLIDCGLVWVQYPWMNFTWKPSSCCAGATLEWPHDSVMRGYVTAPLWLCYGYVVAAAMAAASARREETCLQSLWLLKSSSSLWAHTLPALGSANSMNSRTTATLSRVSDTPSICIFKAPRKFYSAFKVENHCSRLTTYDGSGVISSHSTYRTFPGHSQQPLCSGGTCAQPRVKWDEENLSSLPSCRILFTS